MERNAKDKTVVVTGGASGIGYEIANHFLKNGAKVVIVIDINEDQGTTAVQTLIKENGKERAVFIKADVTKDLEGVSRKIIDEYKTIDVFVNSAGTVDEHNLRKVFELNTIALIEWSMKFFEHMRIDKNGKGGTIINIASIGVLTVDPVLVYYRATKYAVLGFTTTLGHEKNFEKFGVRTLTICPGITKTNLKFEGMIWKEHIDDVKEIIRNAKIQEATDVGKKTVEAYAKAESGSTWIIVNGDLKEYVRKNI